MILALVIFAVTYLLMLALPKERPWVALCSAAVFMALGQLGVYDFSLSAALGAVDYNVLLMMSGTMGIVSLFIRSRMPARLAEQLIVRVPMPSGLCACWHFLPGYQCIWWTMWPQCSWWHRWAWPLPAS